MMRLRDGGSGEVRNGGLNCHLLWDPVGVLLTVGSM
jgi:hypothetical protein